MAGWVQDSYGGFALTNPPQDMAPTMRFQGVGPRRLAVGADIGVTHITLTTDADTIFDVNNVVSLSIRSPQETAAILGALYDDSYTLVPFDFSLSGRWPAVLALGPGVTVTPDTGKALTFLPNWNLVWLLKTGSNAYALFGDLGAAA
jgi:hypothetical protein